MGAGSGKLGEMPCIGPMATASVIELYLQAGIGAHGCVFLLLAGLVAAWLIHRKGLGLRHRLLFMLAAFLPLLTSICLASADAVSHSRSFRNYLRKNPYPCEIVYRPAEYLSVISIGAFGSLVLLATSSLLLVKQAGPRHDS